MDPALRAFLGDSDVEEVTRRLETLTVEHPKLAKTVEIVRDELHRNPKARVIVFSQYRGTVDHIVEEVERLHDPGVRPARFVGQATHGDDTGLSQREQGAILDRFRAGEVNCLVATSVAEEGLDIPATDLVVFYEPVPDVIRTIQRRGRTAGRERAARSCWSPRGRAMWGSTVPLPPGNVACTRCSSKSNPKSRKVAPRRRPNPNGSNGSSRSSANDPCCRTRRCASGRCRPSPTGTRRVRRRPHGLDRSGRRPRSGTDLRTGR